MNHFRGMPDDFPEHAAESYRELMKRYRADFYTIRRWKDLRGIDSTRKRPVVRTDGQGCERAYESMSDAARLSKVRNPSNICDAIRRGGKAGGYWWRYAEERP